MIPIRRVLTISALVSFYCAALATIFLSFPEMSREDKQHFKYPRNLDDAKQLGKVLSKYKDRHFTSVLMGVAGVYLTLQSFAIPGSIFLTILSGYLFPFVVALTLVCMCSACGATVCYYLSRTVGKRIITRHFPERLAKWQRDVWIGRSLIFFIRIAFHFFARLIQINGHRDHLLNYLVFLRVTPLLPNWFINIAAPILNIPIAPFFFGTLLGVAPPSFLFIQAGTTLQMMTNDDIAGVMWSWSSIATLSFFALISLLPVLYKRFKLKEE